jgi:hypothetical protein
MRTIKLFGILLLAVSIASASTLFNCTAANSTSAGAITTSAFGTVTAGDAIVVFSTGVGTTITDAITDTSGAGSTSCNGSPCTWVQVGSYQTATDRGAMWAVNGIFSGYTGATITSTWSGGALSTIVACEIGSASTGTLVDATAGATGSGSSMTSSSLTTTNANDLLVYCVGNPASNMGAATAGSVGSGTGVIPSGATGSTGRTACEYLSVSSTQSTITAAMSWANSTTHQMGVFAAFELASTPKRHAAIF